MECLSLHRESGAAAAASEATTYITALEPELQGTAGRRPGAFRSGVECRNRFKISSPEADAEQTITSLVAKRFGDAFLRTKDSLGETVKESWVEKWDAGVLRPVQLRHSAPSSPPTASPNGSSARSMAAPSRSTSQRKTGVFPSQFIKSTTNDALRSPSQQRVLARALRARTDVFAGGHMAGEVDTLRFYDELLRHLRGASQGVV